MNKKSGKVYLTGGGCGDPRLLTLRAAQVLRRCDVVVYDSLVEAELLQWTGPECERIYVGKRYGSHAREQSQINGLLVEKALEGKTVVRLKGGDPYVFGRGGEEFLVLKEAGISCEEIPGISSAIAVPAAAGIPVTHRGLSTAVTVVTGTVAEGDGRLRLDFDTLARLDGTLVILMGMHHLQEITAGLLAAGKSEDTPCAVIMEGTTSRQRCLRTMLGRLYEEAKEHDFTSPAVIVIGAVAKLQLTGLEEDIEEDALAGITVGVTGTPHFAGKLAAALKQEGAEVKDMSFMEVRRTEETLPKLWAFGWLVFTSPNGVSVFLDKMRQQRRDLRSLSGKKIAVIGPGTAAVLEANGMYADYMPQIYDAEHLAEGLAEQILQEDLTEKQSEVYGGREQVLFLRAKQGSDRLPAVLQEKGIPYVDYPLYELGVCEEKRTAAVAERPDYIVFGSAMGVRAYFEGLGQSGIEENREHKYVCIGERCREAFKEYTASSCLVAAQPGIEAIVECIRKDVIGNNSPVEQVCESTGKQWR